MQYRDLGRTGVRVSPLALGTMNFGRIGNTTQEVLASLREARSGVVHAGDYARYGFRCQVHGSPDLNVEELVDRRAMRFHGKGTAWNHVAMDQAIRDAGLKLGVDPLGVGRRPGVRRVVVVGEPRAGREGRPA